MANNPKLTVVGLFLMTVLQGCGNSDGGQNSSTEQGSTPGVAGTSSTSAGTMTSVAGTSSVATATGGKSSIVTATSTGGNVGTGGSSADQQCFPAGSICQASTDCCAPVACISGKCIAPQNGTGGTSSVGTTATAATGGNTGNNATGGVTSVASSTGGAKSTGGSSAVQPTTGGASSATGGSNATGGAVATTGGSQTTGGSNATGGETSSTGGYTGTGGSSEEVRQCFHLGWVCQYSDDCCANEAVCISGKCEPLSNGTGGGTSATGGSTSTGGATSVASTGGAVATTGGSAQCVPTIRPSIQNSPSVISGSSCSAYSLVRDTSYPIQYRPTSVSALSADDVTVAASTQSETGGNLGQIVQWNGLAWSQTSLPTHQYGDSYLVSVQKDASGEIWASGNGQCYGCGQQPKVIHYKNGNWGEVNDNLPSSGTAQSVFKVGGNVYTLINSNLPNVMVLSGQSWQAMPIDPDTERQLGASCAGKQLWGTSPSDLFWVGYCSTEGQPTRGIVVHYDGCLWKLVASVPIDVFLLQGVSGDSKGNVVAVGYDSSSRGVVIQASGNDLETWKETYTSEKMALGSVVMPRPNVYLATGGVDPVIRGGGRVVVNGTSAAVDSESEDVSSSASVGTDAAVMVGQPYGTREGRFYRFTCQ